MNSNRVNVAVFRRCFFILLDVFVGERLCLPLAVALVKIIIESQVAWSARLKAVKTPPAVLICAPNLMLFS
ncbi:MAG: hypothetical protein M5U34_39995 [Chloroflexi bacterium]|nr:hypothetical protein [Chloroflexota bacterium]